jgi:hypothetical protein
MIQQLCKLDIYSEELKMYFYTKMCTWMFIATSFIRAKTWKSQDVLKWVDSQINWYIWDYSVLKRNELSGRQRAGGL